MNKLTFASSLAIIVIVLVLGQTQARVSKDKNQKPYRIVCYLGSWANYRHGNGKFLMEDINPHLCTHLVYGFTKLENNEIAVFDPYLDLKTNWGLDGYGRFNRLRERNPQLTTLVAIGGWNEGSLKYSIMAKDPASRKVFVKSVVNFLLEHAFDGLDFDWEYPANRDSTEPEVDRDNFVKCLKELREAFEPYGFILTAAVSAGKNTVDTAYDIPQINKYLDFINLMAYDYHGAWENITGHNAPLYGYPGEVEGHHTLNVNYSVNYWLTHGATKDKLVLGMPLYGRCLTLALPSKSGLGVNNIGPGLPGPFTNTEGMIGYNEMSERFAKEKWNVVWSEPIKAPYAVKGNQWCGYDNEKSIRIKTEFAKSLGIGGGMVWSLETDDFRGIHHPRKYPLLTVMNEVLSGHSFVEPTPDPSVSTTSRKDEVTSPPDGSRCSAEGFFPVVNDCRQYYWCIRLLNGWQKVYQMCPPGTAFHSELKHCDFPERVPRCGLEDYSSRSTKRPLRSSTVSPRFSTSSPRTSRRSSPSSSSATRIISTSSSRISQSTSTTSPRASPISPSSSSATQSVSTSSPSTSTRSSSNSFSTSTTEKTHVSSLRPSPSWTSIPRTEHVLFGNLTCTEAGHFPHESDCKIFYKCSKYGNVFRRSLFTCPGGLVFNVNSRTCDFIANVPRCQGIPTAPGSTLTKTTSPHAVKDQALVPKTAPQSGEPVELSCKHEGKHAFPNDCKRYYQCVISKDEMKIILFNCPLGTVFDHVDKNCRLGNHKAC